MRFRRWIVLPLAVAMMLAAAACGDDDDDDNGAEAGGDEPAAQDQEENTGAVNVLSAMEPEEAESLNGVLGESLEADYDAEIEASGNFEEQLQIRSEGGDLDLAMLPQPGAVADAAESGAVSLEDMGFDIDELRDTFGDVLLDLVEVDGQHYGLPSNVNLKSMIWYPADNFEEAGYEVPETWDDLIALSDQIVEDGGTPWCVGFQSEGSTGWPATDWMEDIMLRTAGVDAYDQWVSHELPFTDEAVVTAGEQFGEVMFGDGYVLGGAEQTPNVAFGDAPTPMFEDEPGCWLHRQANFINAFFPEDAEANVDYDWFPFPEIDEQNTLFGGEFLVAYRNAPEVKDFMEQFTGAEVQCAQGGIQGTSRISAHPDVETDCYANEILGEASEYLTEQLQAGTARFDASDQMPPEVGSGSFWTGMMDYVQGGPDSLNGVLEEIDSSWPS
jgi:alpha-glucoside transport system substrate-binding protein